MLLWYLEFYLFYYNTIQVKNISYSVSEVRKIFDNTQVTNKIKILDKNSKEIKQDVFIATISLWNSGNLPIEPFDIRLPIELASNLPIKIIDYKIIKEIDPEITNFKLIETKNNMNILWKHFDPKSGLKFQLLYQGKENVNFFLKGKILGINNFIFEDESNKNFSALIVSIFNTILSLITLIYLFYMAFSDVKSLVHNDKQFRDLIINLDFKSANKKLNFLRNKQLKFWTTGYSIYKSNNDYNLLLLL